MPNPAKKRKDAAETASPSDGAVSEQDATATQDAAETASPSEPTKPKPIHPPGHCTGCGNPHVSMYGEGKWSCGVCGAKGTL